MSDGLSKASRVARRVLNAIPYNGPVTRAALMEALNLSSSSVGPVLSRLLNLGLIEKGSIGEYRRVAPQAQKGPSNGETSEQ